MYQDAREAVETIVAKFKVSNGSGVLLDYYRTQEGLDAVQLPELDEPVGYYNARMRLVGSMLEQKEIPYTYSYADGQNED